MRFARSTRRQAVAAVAAGLLLAGCSSGSGSTSAAGNATGASSSGGGGTSTAGTSATASSGSSSTSAAAGSSTALGGSAAATTTPATGGKVVHLQFWSWLSNVDKIVALWNTSHPDIQVSVNSASQGDALVTKLLTADKAGNPPDLFQAEYQALPALVSAGVAGDLTKDIGPIKSKFTQAAWNNVSFSGTTYAIPQDFGPMMLFYRTDLFKQYGLAVPTTWA